MAELITEWRDQKMRYHFEHGCGYTSLSTVGDLLRRGGLCMACWDADPDAPVVPAEQWRQVRPSPPVSVTVNVAGGLP